MYHVNAQGVDERMINVHHSKDGSRTCVVLPQPVSPLTTSTWLSRIN